MPLTRIDLSYSSYAKLFLVGVASLFFQLAAIRWFSAYVSFLHYFANIVWIACFVGLSIGTLRSQLPATWLTRFPRLSLYSYLLAVFVHIALSSRWGFTVSGDRDQAQTVFFGLEGAANDFAKFVVPIELIVALVFAALAVLSIGYGEALGAELAKCENRLKGYIWNIAGSVAGILLFIAASFFHLPALAWFALVALITADLLRREKLLKRAHLAYLIFGLILIFGMDLPFSKRLRLQWSPYYLVSHQVEKNGINVDNIGHQVMYPFAESGVGYSLIHLLNRDSGGHPFKEVLVIGAGSGNDVSHALHQGAGHVDAVEIDPVIADIGRRYHPDAPYGPQSPVNLQINDGRAFLQRAPDNRYDLIVYALVDSLLSSSSFSGVRLESFLFTKEALEQVRRTLKKDGVFVTYNVFRKGWIVHHLAQLVEEVFGEEPLVLSIPQVDTIAPDDELNHLTVILAGNVGGIRGAFERKNTFDTYESAAIAAGANGFNHDESGSAPLQLKPVRVAKSSQAFFATDNWPQLYLRRPSIPFRPYITMLSLLAVITAILFYRLVPQGLRLGKADPRMFFLGAGFLLLESRAVIQLQLLFGNTWLVTSFVFTGILLLALMANLLVSKVERISVPLVYVLLFLSLGLTVVAPYTWIMQYRGFLVRALAVAVTLMPIPLGSMVFADTFKKSAAPRSDLAANFLGACVGGALETLSLVTGIRGLLAVAMLIYLLSVYRRQSPRAALG